MIEPNMELTRKVDGGESGLLDRVIRGELDAENVPFGGDNWGQVSPAEEPVLPQFVLAQLAPDLDVVVLAILLERAHA